MVGAARACRTVVDLSGVGFGDEVLCVLCILAGADHQHHRELAHQRDGRQVFVGVVRELGIERSVEDMVPLSAESTV